MRILVHDRSGHPFQVQLSRELARRGHRVLHSYGAFFQGPKGAVATRPGDPESFEIEAIELPGVFRKYSPKRILQERRYAAALLVQARRFRPDALLLSNVPPDAMAYLFRRRESSLGRWVVWIQDLYGMAITRILGPRLLGLGTWLGRYYSHLEAKVARQADRLVLISEDFEPTVESFGVSSESMHVIPNWAPLDELPALPRTNAWAREHAIEDSFTFLYSGTMGLKHDPDILLSLARSFCGNEGRHAEIIVISEGLGADHIRDRSRKEGLDNLRVLPFVPYSRLPEVLASADVLVAVLDEKAGAFSVPSKVLSYLCAKRALLLAVPGANRASRMVREIEAGLTAEPGDRPSFLESAHRLYEDGELRESCASKARCHAEQNFDIGVIAARFEAILGGGESDTPRQHDSREQ